METFVALLVAVVFAVYLERRYEKAKARRAARTASGSGARQNNGTEVEK